MWASRRQGCLASSSSSGEVRGTLNADPVSSLAQFCLFQSVPTRYLPHTSADIAHAGALTKEQQAAWESAMSAMRAHVVNERMQGDSGPQAPVGSHEGAPANYAYAARQQQAAHAMAAGRRHTHDGSDGGEFQCALLS